jgi:hypothetical protein
VRKGFTTYQGCGILACSLTVVEMRAETHNQFKYR